MSLSEVKIAEEVWLTCVTHALSTETEEVMGLLLGDIISDDGRSIALVWGAAPQTRSDRRKDRVETNPEQLAAASAQAERISEETGRRTRVIGWYHSHPHITVFPSHVDVRTQGMYQLLDPGFIGLIFSCFSEDANKVGRIQATAFQACNGWQNDGIRMPMQSNAGSALQRNSTTIAGDMDFGKEPGSTILLSGSTKGGGEELDVTAPKATNGPNSHTNALGELFTHTGSEPGSNRDGNDIDKLRFYDTTSAKDLEGGFDSFELAESMQEALHRSNLDLSGAEYTRKEVPLQVIPSHMLARIDFPLTSLISLQKILFDEEQTAFNHAIMQTTRKGKVHPLTVIHHAATYQASLCKLMEYCLSPVLSSLWDRLLQNNLRLALLREEANSLQLEALSSSSRTSHSKRHTSAGVVRGNLYSASPERCVGDSKSDQIAPS